MEEIKFTDYARACSDAGTRTRSSIYLLVAVLVVIYSVYFNTQVFRFSRQRMTTFETAFNCVRNSQSSDHLQEMLNAGPCKESLEWAQRMDLPTAYDEANTPPHKRWTREDVISIYQDTLNMFHRKRNDLRTVQVPFFGSVIDLEDLGLLSGISFLILLLVVGANMRRELDWLRLARSRATSVEAMEYLRNIQVLSSPKRDNVLFKWVPILVFALAPLVHLWLCQRGVQTPNNINLLLGHDYARLLFSIEGIFLILISVFVLWNCALWGFLVEALSEPAGHWTRLYQGVRSNFMRDQATNTTASMESPLEIVDSAPAEEPTKPPEQTN